jgi:hypothetical protein
LDRGFGGELGASVGWPTFLEFSLLIDVREPITNGRNPGIGGGGLPPGGGGGADPAREGGGGGGGGAPPVGGGGGGGG